MKVAEAQRGEGFLLVVCLCCVVLLSRSWRLSFLVLVLSFTALALGWCSGMVSDGFQTQRIGSCIPGKERTERIFAGAIAIDGRKEWICKYCPETNV